MSNSGFFFLESPLPFQLFCFFFEGDGRADVLCPFFLGSQGIVPSIWGMDGSFLGESQDCPPVLSSVFFFFFHPFLLSSAFGFRLSLKVDPVFWGMD